MVENALLSGTTTDFSRPWFREQIKSYSKLSFNARAVFFWLLNYAIKIGHNITKCLRTVCTRKLFFENFGCESQITIGIAIGILTIFNPIQGHELTTLNLKILYHHFVIWNVNQSKSVQRFNDLNKVSKSFSKFEIIGIGIVAIFLSVVFQFVSRLAWILELFLLVKIVSGVIDVSNKVL